MSLKLAFGEDIGVVATAVGGEYEVGTEQFSVQALAADGTTDVSDQFTVEGTGLDRTVVRSKDAATRDTECTGLVTVRADGDADADEEAPITGVLAFSYDSPNATSFALAGTVIPATPVTD